MTGRGTTEWGMAGAGMAERGSAERGSAGPGRRRRGSRFRRGRAALIAALACAAAAFAAPAPAAAEPSAFEEVEAGNAAWAAGDPNAAGAAWERADALLPDTAAIAHNLGLLALRRFKADEAAGHLDRAARTADPALAASARYNLGVLRHRQALDNLQSFQDAKTPLEQASALYREALRLDPSLDDARHNLELAYRLLLEVEKQNVLFQSDARVRDQKGSPNVGQNSRHRAEASRRDRRDAKADKRRQPDDAEAQQTPQGKPSRDESGQAGDAANPREMSPDQAQQLVELTREKAKAMESLRRQWRRARMGADPAEKNW